MTDYVTVQDLSQLYYLNREIKKDKDKLELLRNKIHPSSPTVDDMPRGSDFHNSKVENLVAEIVDLEMIVEARMLQSVHEKNRLERYINNIPDCLTRAIFEFRFVDGLPWNQVAASIGGNNTEDSVKKRCYRYLNKSNKL